ncbi:unnamed protein product [Allacma fusca]|uniref:Uncharacterized protein n=1 Tax=Allacma fusca TaxID=39272 RepID=A0A8J2LFH5_9HEXA|nr:unnamed protein product [Allacma fusca]
MLGFLFFFYAADYGKLGRVGHTVALIVDLDHPNLNPSIPYSRADTTHRPVTRSLSRLATPKEPHIPCPRTLRTKNRNPLSASDRMTSLPSSQWSDKSSNMGNNNNLNSEASSTTSPTTFSRISTASTTTMFPSTRVHTRSSRTQTFVTSNNVAKINNNQIGSSSRSTFTTPCHSITKVSTVFRSSLMNKPPAQNNKIRQPAAGLETRTWGVPGGSHIGIVKPR